MPSVYTFSHSSNVILAEMMKVLEISTSNTSFREQWILHAESVVEPVGWEALWKLSKQFCNKLGVRFPCVAHVCVQNVDFESLSAHVEVRGVQHERVELPATMEGVPLIELWPTTSQTEQCVDAAGTAEFIFFLRFYYNNIWMPWDDLDNKYLLANTIEERMKLYVAMHDGSMPMQVVRAASLLRADAIRTYDKIRETEAEDDSDEELNDENDSMLPDNFRFRYAELHSRLDLLQSKWTTFENPMIRNAYLVDVQNKLARVAGEKRTNVLWRGGNISEFLEISAEMKRFVQPHHKIAVCMSAEEALSQEPEQLIVCSDAYEIPDVPLGRIIIRSLKGSILSSSEIRSCLLVTSEYTELHDLTLHCRRVNTAVCARDGELRIKNCTFTDDSINCQSDFAQGLVVMGGARVLLDSCTFDNFYTGLVVHSGAQVEMRNCVVRSCGVGIQMFQGSEVKLTSSRVSQCLEQCVRYEASKAAIKSEGKTMEGLAISPCSKVGVGDGDLCVVKQETEFA